MAKLSGLNRLPPSWIHWGNFFTPKDDATILNVSFWSNVPEKHATGVGYAAVVMAFVVYVFGDVGSAVTVLGGTGGLAMVIRMVNRYRTTLHLRDAFKEIAYVALGMILAVATLLVGYVLHIVTLLLS